MKEQRFESLDALRGVAALVVMLSHAFVALAASLDSAWGAAIRFSPARLLVAGHSSVVLFFVLSGYVLAVPLLTRPDGRYASFLVRRLFRIYIPFAVSVLACAALLYVVPRPAVAEASQWFRERSVLDITPSLVSNHLLMLGRADDIDMNGPLWSLIHELRISLVLPLVALVVARRRVEALLFGLVLFTASDVLIHALGETTPGVVFASRTVAGSFLVTLRYGLFFILGFVLYAWRPDRYALLDNRPVRVGFWALALASLMAPATARWSDLVIGLGSGLMIVLIVNRPPRLLMTSPLRWLGRVSFSLYLTHLPILIASVYLLSSTLTIYGALVAGIAVSLLFAELFYRAVERPSHTCGRRLASRLETPVRTVVDPAGVV